MDFSIDRQNKKINVEKEFAAPLNTVWSAWTDSKILDKWWAPKPWQARTKSMDFREGGSWLYAMVGPEGEEHWARFDYTSIKPQLSFSGKDSFCDENGTINTAMTGSSWKSEFSEKGDKTVVSTELTFESIDQLEQMIQMGFKEGFEMGLGNLDQLLPELK
jgi:uncharacterized protein YndB with AHSA1/START domain